MIKRIAIENFKSLRRVELTLGQMNFFVGTNASGKSNLFDAIRVLHLIAGGFSTKDLFEGGVNTGGGETWPGLRGGLANAIYRQPKSDSPGSSAGALLEIDIAAQGWTARYQFGFNADGDTTRENLSKDGREIFAYDGKDAFFKSLEPIRAIKSELQDRYRHFDLWLFLPDADRAASLGDLEASLHQKGIPLRCCAAQPEVEVWLLAGHRQVLNLPWQDIRNHPRLKEEVFEPFLVAHGDLRAPGKGRERLMNQSLTNYRSLLEMCPELKVLHSRLQEFA